jgi:hypothetical protein
VDVDVHVDDVHVVDVHVDDVGDVEGGYDNGVV